MRPSEEAARALDHVFLTRFNLPSRGVESLIRSKEGWLRQRVELFETYCLSSILAQTQKNFHWIVYFDPESPQWLMDRIALWSVSAPLRPIFRAEVSLRERLADIRSVVGAPGQRLLTTNLDNDDGLAIDFVERLQRASPLTGRTALYFEWGLIKSGDRLYLRRDTDNAFCSVSESWSNPETCWAAFHNELGRLMPQKTLSGKPGWLQVIHGDNVSNRVRGHRVSVTPFRRSFPQLSGTAEPSPAALGYDLLLARPLRTVQEAARAAIKTSVRTLLGKQATDAIKTMWLRLRNMIPTFVQWIQSAGLL